MSTDIDARTVGENGVACWMCAHCDALISESIIGDPPEASTRVRCPECGGMTLLTRAHVAFPKDEADALENLVDAIHAWWWEPDVVTELAIKDALADLDAIRGGSDAI